MKQLCYWAISIFQFMFFSHCTNHVQSNPDHLISENTGVYHESAREECYSYFQFKNLIEDFPFNKESSMDFYRKYLVASRLKPISNSFRSIPEWESIGPNNIAGRTLCVAINPMDTNQLWIGSAGSGLWKSNKGGLGTNAWQYIPTGFPVISVSSIAIQRDNPYVVYIGTGEIYNYQGYDGGIHTRTLRGSKGIGILKSNDGGLHWTISLNWISNNQTAVWKIIINPKNPAILYAATNIGIYKSSNAGQNWIQVLDLPLASDLIIDSEQPEILYAGIGGIDGPYYGVYKTIDGGTHWERMNTSNDTIYNGRIMLANYKGNPKRVYAAYSDEYKTLALMRSRDGFDSSRFYLPIKDVCEHQGWYAKCLHIKDDDSSKIIIGGVDLYYDSTGTGNQLFNLQNWKIKIHADLHDIISNPFDPNKIYIATDGGLYRSNDFARTFYACNEGYLSAQFYTGNVSSHSSKIIGGLQDNRSVLLDSGLFWNSIHQADGTFNAFHPQYDSILYVSSQYQNLYTSLDLGKTWKELIKANTSVSFVAPFSIQSKDAQGLLSGGNQLLHTSNGGLSWDTTFLMSNEESIVAIETNSLNDNQLYVSSLNVKSRESHLYFSKDGGKNLELRETGIPERFIRDLAIDYRNANLVYLALGGFGAPGIMKSEDAGRNWSFTENKDLPDVPFHSILIDPKDNDILYAGCDFGLYVSINQGESWTPYNLHPYDLVAVYDIKYSPVENKLILFTHGFGAFKCSLLDKSIVTNTKNTITDSHIAILFNDRIEFENKIQDLKSLVLINADGKYFKLYSDGNAFSTRSLASGLYYICSEKTALSENKIIVIH